MSTKSKARIARRASERPSSTKRPTRSTAEKKVAGEIIGAVLNAITFGALEGPASGRKPAETQSKPA
jgi:hypothetical protein